jgi:DNA-binding transcriptional ArsR family regulator
MVLLKGFSLGDASRLFRLLGDEGRLRILLALRERELDVTTLCTLVEQSPPSVSTSLTLMILGGVVANRCEGEHNFYRLDSQRVRDLLQGLPA